MAVYSSNTETVQLAKETTPGVAGTAFELMPNTAIDVMGMGDDADTYIGSGQNYVGGTSDRRERGGGTYSGPCCFDEDVRIFDSIFEKASPTGAGVDKTREWTPALTGADTFQTYTGERGQAGAIDKFLYGVFNSLTMRVTDTEASRSGDFLAQHAVPGTAMTASPTTLPSSPVGAVNWELFWANDMSALDSESNKITTGFEWEFGYGPKFAGYFPINKSNRSFAGLAQLKPATTLRLVTGYDVSGSDYAGPLTLAKKRAGTVICFRCKGTGAVITGAVVQTYIVDVAARILNVPGRTPLQDVLLGHAWALQPSRDPVSDLVVRARLINSLVA